MSHVIFTPITVLLDKYCIDYPIQWIRETDYIIYSFYQTTSIIFIIDWIEWWCLWEAKMEDCEQGIWIEQKKNFFIELSCVRWNMRQQLMISSGIVFKTIDVTRSHSCFFLTPHLDVLTRNILFYSKFNEENYFFNQMLSK